MNPKVWLRLAEEVSQNATCPRINCGTVLTKDGAIISVGWNGSAANSGGCCHVEDGHCLSAVHSEVRAITAAARQGHSTLGATAFLNQMPCQNCLSALSEAGVVKVWYSGTYHLSAPGNRWVSPELMDHLDVQQYRETDPVQAP